MVSDRARREKEIEITKFATWETFVIRVDPFEPRM